MDNYQYKVLVDCKTYNHVNYIEDALNGFCMQETKFPFICVVMDDASTDGEQNVINDYLERNFDLTDKQFCSQEETEDYRLLLVRHKNNLNCYLAVFFLKYNHYGKKDKFPYYERWVKRSKYIAMCDGDDYWIDPLKLQKQVEILEKDNGVTIVCGGFISVRDGVKVSETCYKENSTESFVFNIKQWTKRWLTKTLTVLYRPDCLTEYYDKLKHYKYERDIHLFYHLLKKGKGVYISEVLGVYNIHEGSACSTVSKENNAIYGYQCYKELYQYNKDNITREMYLGSINTRLLDRAKNQKSFVLFLEGLKITKSLNEVSSLLLHLLFPRAAKG